MKNDMRTKILTSNSEATKNRAIAFITVSTRKLRSKLINRHDQLIYLIYYLEDTYTYDCNSI